MSFTHYGSYSAALIASLAALAVVGLTSLALLWRSRRQLRRHRHEAERAEGERAFQSKLLETLHDAVIGLDLDLRIRSWNQAAQRLYGWAASEVFGKHVREVLRTDFPGGEPDRERLFKEIAATGRVRTQLAQYRRDGSRIEVDGESAAIYGADGAVTGYVLANRDVTEKKAMQAQLLFADRMSSMGTLAAGVAHEINNPLAFILANLSFVSEELSALSPSRPELSRAVDETRQGALRVRDIVRDLKTFSRPDEKRDEAVDVREVIQLSMNLVQNEVRHRARLVVDLCEVPPVAASAHRLGQVFVNLLINAAQAMREGEAHRNELHVACRPTEDGRVLVEFADTGCGIPPEVLPRIFEPFFTTKPVGVGTGLGLSICHGIVTGLGGEIRVESQRGRGSKFRVLLPGGAPRAAAANETQPERPRPRRSRILVIDDEAMVARAIERMLARDHQVVAVTSAGSALTCLGEEPAFDVIICDLMMPEMTGMELHEQLARTAPALSQRMIFLTGGAFTSRAREFLDRVPNPRLEKPFDPEALRALADDLLSGQVRPALGWVVPIRA